MMKPWPTMHVVLLAILLSQTASRAAIFTQADAGAKNEASDQFGRVLTTGDFNGDGFADLVVSAPYEDTDEAEDAGRLFVFKGSAQGLSSSAEIITQNSIDNATNEDGDRLGWALAVGNFNGDKYEDLAVGIPYEDTEGGVNAGMVAILFGSAQGLLPSTTEAFTEDHVSNSSGEAGNRFGYALSVGNFNGDLYDDLAVGIPGKDTDGKIDAGMACIFFGSAQGMLPAVTELISQDPLINSSNEAGDQFGFALAAGNFNGDAHDDLAVGIPFEDTADATEDAGMVGVFLGSAQGLLPARSEAFTQNSIDGSPNEEGDQLGKVLAVGNFDNDQYDDLAIGVAYEDSGSENAGSTYVMYGSGNGLLPARSEVIGQRKAYDTNERDDLAGSALTTGDFDGDGFGDLIIGVPQEDIIHSGENSGTIQAFFGFSGGLLDGLDPHRSYWAGQVSFAGTEDDGDRFGFALAAGDFDNDGRDGLVVGTPFKDIGTIQDCGAVYVQEIDPALPHITARAAIVMNRRTGEILGSKMPDSRWAMASTTKIMTALLAVEAVGKGERQLDAMEEISFLAARVVGTKTSRLDTGGGGSMCLWVGDRVSLEDLLYGTMLESGNDAALAVAEAVSGSVSDFVSAMNTRADELGLNRTVFASPNGRDPDKLFVHDLCKEPVGFEQSINFRPGCAQYSTARDLALLADFALSKELFKKIVGTLTWQTTNWVDVLGDSQDKELINRNEWLPEHPLGNTYRGAYGVKTGTSANAGLCLVSAAERSGVDLVAVVMGSTKVMGRSRRYADSRAILDFAFSRSIPWPSRLAVSANRLPSGNIAQLNLSFPVKEGKTYRIEKSTDLKDWQPIATGLSGQGTIEYTFPLQGIKWFLRAGEE